MPHSSKRKGNQDEKWRPIDGYPLYEVSSQGRVRSWKNNRHGRADQPKILSQSVTAQGYNYVGLRAPDCEGADRLNVHRLVAEAFIRSVKDDERVCHRNDVKTDNRLDNIYIGTPQDNANDKIRNDKQPRGEDFDRSLTADDVRFIREKRGEMKQSELAEMFGIHQVTVSEIQLRKIWDHID